MINTINMIVTDVGEFPAPANIVKAHAIAKLRKDRRVDGRTKAGKHFYRLERKFMQDKLGEWLADGAMAELAQLDPANG